MHKFIELVKGYFSITEKEARGFIILSFILLLIIFVPYGLKLIPAGNDSTIEAPIVIHQTETPIADSTPHFQPVPFDPNLITEVEWGKLGINNTLSKRIEKYKASGGRFKTKSDLKKIYGFPEETYLALHQFILLPDSLVKTQKVSKVTSKEVLKATSKKQFDINNATATELESIYGIGPVFSTRILKYRKLLGGFVSKDQLSEVYGLDSIARINVQKQIFVEADFQPEKIKIPASGLPYHPYLKKDQAKVIIKMIADKKEISRNSLEQSGSFNKEDLSRLLPYLPVSNQ